MNPQYPPPVNYHYIQQAYNYPLPPVGGPLPFGPGVSTQFKTKEIEHVTADTPITGWRMMSLNGSLLMGQFGVDWPERQMKAECGAGRDKLALKDHLTKGVCNCGVHAVDTPEPELPRVSCSSFLGVAAEFGVAVAVKVQLFGTVVKHERGYRAEYARMESIHLLIPRRCPSHQGIQLVEKPAIVGTLEENLPAAFFSPEDFQKVLAMANPPKMYTLKCSEEYVEEPFSALIPILQERYQVPVYGVNILDFLSAADRGDL